MAVWDGEQYVYQDSHGWGWWNTAKMLWHYGLSPIKARNAMKNMVKRYALCTFRTARCLNRGSGQIPGHLRPRLPLAPAVYR